MLSTARSLLRPALWRSLARGYAAEPAAAAAVDNGYVSQVRAYYAWRAVGLN
jgi:hypothetical protein